MRISDWSSDVCSSDLADLRPGLLEALDGDLAIDPRHHHLRVARITGALHRDQVAVEDAVVTHRVALHPQQVVGPVGEQRAIEQHVALGPGVRSDEHTSALPSLMRNSYAVT